MKSDSTLTPESQLETSYSLRYVFTYIVSEWLGIPKPKPTPKDDATKPAPKIQLDEVREKKEKTEILNAEGLTVEEYDAVMRRRCHDAWLNEVITCRDLRSDYFKWIKRVFGVQLVVANLILLVCAVFGYVTPAIVAGSLAGITGLVATVTKYLFSAESTKMANDLTKVVGSQKNEAKG